MRARRAQQGCRGALLLSEAVRRAASRLLVCRLGSAVLRTPRLRDPPPRFHSPSLHPASPRPAPSEFFIHAEVVPGQQLVVLADTARKAIHTLHFSGQCGHASGCAVGGVQAGGAPASGVPAGSV